MLEKMKWTIEPLHYEINDKMVSIMTAPHTDLWQRTYYHFRNDNAPVLQMETDDKFFSFVVKQTFLRAIIVLISAESLCIWILRTG